MGEIYSVYCSQTYSRSHQLVLLNWTLEERNVLVDSTMSASLNTVAGTLYEDFVAPFYKKSPKSDASASLIMKLIVLVVGVVCVLLVFVVERLGSIMQVRDYCITRLSATGCLGHLSRVVSYQKHQEHSNSKARVSFRIEGISLGSSRP